ncbi:MAG TPA: GNAT family N-acetyltransferase [Streptosporangiaceae bacterium]|nr:GNAT family N-acetyltransferase [Streptosporangiaceae bacterium]
MPVTFLLLDAAEVTTVDDYLALQAETCPQPQPERFRVHRRQPGFTLAEARNGQYLVGYAYGMPLRPSTDWWRRLTAPLPDDVTAEHQGRTFALTGLAVRAAWRRQGIGRTLQELILHDRPEERATSTAPTGAAAAQAAYLAWGWHKVARTSGQPVHDVFLLDLTHA